MSYTHGTYVAYAKHKCRCYDCSEYQRSRNAKNRADRLTSGRLSHGTRSAYDAGCRCNACKSARSAASAVETEQLRALKRLAEEFPERFRQIREGGAS